MKTKILFAVAALWCAVAQAEVAPVSETEALTWKRYVLPLPHEMSLTAVVRLRPTSVAFKLRAKAGALEQQALSELQGLFQEKAGITPTGKEFEILLGVLDDQGAIDGVPVANADRLNALPNRDQAYLIQPDGQQRLVIAALSERGVYYGARTLHQLLEFKISKDKVTIPLVSVVDWPDLEERGFWHMPLNQIPWLTSMKLNHFHATTRFSVQPDKKIVPSITTYIVNDREGQQRWSVPFANARLYAAEVVPGIIHMDFWEVIYSMKWTCCPGFEEAFPELLGKGESAKSPYFGSRKQRVLCATNPLLIKILADIMTTLAGWGAAEVNVWMSEYSGQCGCERCMKEGQFQAEVRSAVEAWRTVRKGYPELKLSVFFGIGGGGKKYPEKAIDEILASLPPEVTFCASGGIRGSALADYAARGGRVASYALIQLSPWQRYSSGDIERRIQYLSAKQYHGALQFYPGYYRADVKKLFDYRLSALAEYSWNAQGRSAREFAAAWATRQGFKNPEKFAEWAELAASPELSRPQSRRPQSRLPYGLGNDLSGSWLSRLPQMIAERKMDESLKQITPEEMDKSIAACQKALELARQLESPDIAAETEDWLRYCQLERQGYRLVDQTVGADLDSETDKQALRQTLKDFQEAMGAYIEAMNTEVDNLNVNKSLTQGLKASSEALQTLLAKVVQELAKQGVQ